MRIRNPFLRHRLRNISPTEDFYFEGDDTRERRRLGSVAPDETRDGIAGAEPQKIGLAIGKGKALMRCPSWRMTANRVGWGPRVCADEVCDKLIRGISLTRQGVALGHIPQEI